MYIVQQFEKTTPFCIFNKSLVTSYPVVNRTDEDLEYHLLPSRCVTRFLNEFLCSREPWLYYKTREELKKEILQYFVPVIQSV